MMIHNKKKITLIIVLIIFVAMIIGVVGYFVFNNPSIQGVIIMETQNDSIKCNVSECKHHTDNDYCSLDSINVVVNDSVTNSTSIEYTDCGSFEQKMNIR